MRPFLQTTHRHLDKSFGDGHQDEKITLTGEKRMVWGGWHDAGDWDREAWHVNAANTLLLAYELAPGKFTDGELKIPESGNGIPDIVDEARWCIDYYRRLQRPDGGVSVGFFESSWPRHGESSYTDSMGWFLYAEDPAASYRYAAGACRLAACLAIAGKPALARPYVENAKRAWEWAGRNLREGDAAKIRDDRFHAAAGLFRATGEKRFEDAFKADLLIATPDTKLYVWSQHDQQWGVWAYVLTDRPGMDKALRERLRRAALHFADADYVATAQKRGGRYGYEWSIPMWWGAATEPRTLPLMVAHRLSRDPKFLAPQYTTCDYMLGGNPLNMTWMTGLGARSPREVFHPDSLHDKIPGPVAGIPPLGPYRYVPEKANGPWEPGYAQQVACYPDAKLWPPHELWFENRLCPPTNEFTVGSMAAAASAYGYLCADRR